MMTLHVNMTTVDSTDHKFSHVTDYFSSYYHYT